ncbi:MAG: SIS domain-containing protein [Flaviflexus sp.]|uniref:SIS domain-containing protein n=1 Tax=Flaviflexus sp. TaxID=1969482 RepID=UPI00352FA146
MSKSVETILRELNAALGTLDSVSFNTIRDALATPRGRWFFTGQGRSGLVAQMSVMRTMHLGIESHVVGGATTPAIKEGDSLVVFSSSGETAVAAHFAKTAQRHDATVYVITSSATSSLARIADEMIVIDLPGSVQFGGSLFEQSALILWDSLILSIIQGDDSKYEDMANRHANLQ